MTRRPAHQMPSESSSSLILPHNILMILVVLLVLLLTILLFFAFFGWRKTEENEKIEDAVVPDGNSKILSNGTVEASQKVCSIAKQEIHEDNARILVNESNSEDNLRELKDSCEKLILKLDDVANLNSEAPEPPESLQSSPKSTSSCVSSAIFTENATSPHRTPSRPTSLSGSSPVLSVASCPAPFFDFKRKTPEFVPRMMTEEFESLNKSIEQRKIDIRDLLRRIESTKRQHRRFSEHLQRVQHDHLLDY